MAAQGDSSAFERLYRAHAAKVHSLARRMIGSHEADEITQDVFVRTWQKLGTFRGDSAFGTWLHRLAVNVMIERRRSSAIQRERFIDDPVAIDELPPGARQVFVLHDVEGDKHREIAVLLEITTGTSKRQLHRARMLMRRHLG